MEHLQESRLAIENAFGQAKFSCALHQTDGVLRLTANDVVYECCPQCFGIWMQTNFPVSSIA